MSVGNMPEEMVYVLITPYTIVTSRTGGVISSLLSSLELEACQISAPTAELSKIFSATLRGRISGRERERVRLQLVADYVERKFSPSGGRRHRVLMLLFRGEKAC